MAVVGRAIRGVRYNIHDWLAQRLTAVVMIVYSLFMAGYIWWHPVSNFADWQGLFHSLPVRLFSLIFLLSLFVHAWLGMRDIFMDYVHSTLIRLGLQTIVILSLLAYAAWAVRILWAPL